MSEPINRIVPYERQFARHPKSIFWNQENNGDITPEMVYMKERSKKYWFDCYKCLHTFDACLRSITRGQWCPYCANKRLCGDANCNICFQKSIASSSVIVKMFDYNKNKKNPNQIFKGGDEKFWLKCVNCPHSYNISAAHAKEGKGCYYCCIPGKKVCEDNDCDFCFQNSYASHPTSSNWSEKNKNVKPRDILKGTNIKYWFDCYDCKNPYLMSVKNRRAGQTCPTCKNKTEKKLHDALKQIYSTIIKEFKTSWCKNKSFLPFDFCIPELKTMIELDGGHHFYDIKHYRRKFIEQHEIDIYKEKCANDNGYHTIRIIQEDVRFDKNDWLGNLQREIEYIKNNQDDIHNRYICNNNEYDIFMETIQ